MRYAGDNPAKKVARLVAWKRMKELLGARFHTGTHLVLLSADAGDIPVLIGLGVPASNIVGVDHDERALRAAQRKYKNIECRGGDVAAIAKELKSEKRKLASAFLDFCAPLRDATVNTAVEVSRHMDPGSLLTIAVKMGREKGDWAAAVNESKEKGHTAFYTRADLMTEGLIQRGAKAKRYILPLDFYQYESRGVGIVHQNPMMVCVAKIAASTKKTAKQLSGSAEFTRIVADHTSIGPLASQLEARGEDSTLLLNVHKESVPPYKAHRTRGTYKGKRAPTVKHKR